MNWKASTSFLGKLILGECNIVELLSYDLSFSHVCLILLKAIILNARKIPMTYVAQRFELYLYSFIGVSATISYFYSD